MSEDKIKSISTKQFQALFAKEVKRLGGGKKAAEKIGVSYVFIMGVLAGRELPSAKILELLGLAAVKTINYRYKAIGV